MIADLMTEVDARVEDSIPELLPMLLEKFVLREGLNPCHRHGVLLVPYIRAQISLHHCKRRFHSWDGHFYRSATAEWEGMGNATASRILTPEAAYMAALTTRDNARRMYRSEPCTCWVQHR